MPYQGLPDYRDGRNYAYAQPGSYEHRQAAPSAYTPQQNAAPSPGAFAQGGMSAQQLQAMQAQNEAAWQRQSQYGSIAYANSQPGYYPAPPSRPQPPAYPQYMNSRPPQYQPVQTAYPQYDGSYDELSLPGPTPPLLTPRQQQWPQHATPMPPDVKPRTAAQMPPPIDTHSLLPALAEEYFTAAHGLGFTTAQRMESGVVAQYQKLIATGLGCLEAALAGGRLEPRLEAKMRLRYAGILLEETENMMEAETVLSKGITLCEQNRYYDLKYSMQVLSAKLMFTKSPKAALKALDSNISDVEAYQHHSWVYVLRLLRATLSLQTGRASDTNAALHNLRHVSKIASHRGDRVLFTYCSLMEALASLHIPGAESAENVERALAAARMYQLDPECKILPLQALGHILDLTASLQYETADRALPKLKAMQVMINEASADPTAWNRRSDSISIPVNRVEGDAFVSSHDTPGLVKMGEDGRDVLRVSLLGRSEIYLLCDLLAGIVRLHTKADDHSALKYFQDGLRLASDSRSLKYTGPLPGTLTKLHWRGGIACYFYIYSAFRSIATTDWQAAKTNLDGLDAAIRKQGSDVEPLLLTFLTYLSGMYCQGTGDLERALYLYQNQLLSLHNFNTPVHTPEEQVRRDLALLSAMNALWIQQSSHARNTSANTALLSTLERYCTEHRNKEIQTAFYLLRATVDTDPLIPQTKTKLFIRSALAGARTSQSIHLICITLNLMCSKFFVGIVGDQAEKSAMAASVQARKSGNQLWMSVADGLLASSFEIEGKSEQAKLVRDEATRLANLALKAPP